MATDLKQIFRQQEMPAAIRSQAREIAEILEPYEEFMRSVNHESYTDALTANGILREEVLNEGFFRKLDAFVESIANHLTFVTRSGQTPSRIRQQLKRNLGIIHGWLKELHENGHVLAVCFLEDAMRAYDLAYIEQAIPNPALRKETAELVLVDPRRERELEGIIRWLMWRDSAHERTKMIKNQMIIFASDLDRYVKDMSPLLDTHLVMSKEQGQPSVAFDLGAGQESMFGARQLTITPQKEDNTLDLFGCRLVLHNGQVVEYFINRANSEIVPPTLKYVSARFLFARYDLEYVYDALRKVTLLAIYEAVTSGRIVPAYWSDEEQIKEELEETEEVAQGTLPVEAEQVAHYPPAKSEEEPHNGSDAQDGDHEPRHVHVARGRVTWSRVLRALKQFGVRVEWNHHPMLVKDGVRVRYANPHDDDARKNARYLHMALRAFKIDRNKFYAVLMA